MYTGADLVADFVWKYLSPKVFLVTGGACAFIVDAIGRHAELDYVCFQHEQAASMAADASWRTTGRVGVTLATSGPGATNLITGIACSWFDSIPSFHITGQVNQSENRENVGANVRQAGFQETDIVDMVRPITKWAHQVKDPEDLVAALPKALEIALAGRMGPVLLDIPMNIQKSHITLEQKKRALNVNKREIDDGNGEFFSIQVKRFFQNIERPLVLIGAGAGLSGSAKDIQAWCESNNIPYVVSWGALTFIDRAKKGFQGSIGVYGSRHANWVVQAADKILVLGSRLDNRQRTGNPKSFAPFASILVVDIDAEELLKFKKESNYNMIQLDLSGVAKYLPKIEKLNGTWNKELTQRKNQMSNGFEAACKVSDLNPYLVINELQRKFPSDSIVVSDCGANLCWVYQSYLPDSSYLFTSGGNSPMGYSLPAAIGAQILNREKSVFCFIGDGGLQMNIQELQTISELKLPIKIIIQNNKGYGIIKQFQDSYFKSRYYATGIGYSIPNFKKIAEAYGIQYRTIRSLDEASELVLESGAMMIDLDLAENSLITPKTEMNRFIHDQFPYVDDGSIEELPFKYPERPSELGGISGATV